MEDGSDEEEKSVSFAGRVLVLSLSCQLEFCLKSDISSMCALTL